MLVNILITIVKGFMRKTITYLICSLIICFYIAGAQVKFPSGVFCSCGPTTGIGSGSVAPNIAKLDFVKGILVRLSWELCEPAEGQYNWSHLDGQIDAALKYGKKISLAIGNGMGAPQWLYAKGVQKIISEMPYKDTIPFPWDNLFLDKWGNFISKLGDRYKNDTTIVLIYATNSSGNGYEMQLPFKTTPTLAEAGYTDDKVISSWQKCLDAFAEAFPNHPVTNDYHPVNGSNKVADSVYYYAKAKYGKRYGANAWWWTQKNTTVYPAQYKILQNSADSLNFAGVQMAYSHTKDSSKFGAGGLPAALDLAINDGVYYWEFWNEDLLNTKFDSLFRAVTDLKKPDDTSISTSGKVVTVTFDGPISGKKITFALYLPPDYENGADSLPVIYNLHGIGGNYQSGTVNVVKSYEQALSKGLIRPAVIVFPDGLNDSFWADSKDGSVMVETNVIHEILPYVESNYRVKYGRCYRVIQGFSMGGAGAVELAAKYPELFVACVNYDGAVGAIRDWKSISTYHPGIAEKMFSNDSIYFKDFCHWENLNKNMDYLRENLLFKFSIGALKAGNEELKKYFYDNNLELEYYQSLCDHNFTCILEENGETNWMFIEKSFGCSFTDVNEKLNTGNEPFISPNPASEYMEIYVGDRHACSVQDDIKIYNAIGECVMKVETSLSPVSTKINISQLQAGLYYVRIGSIIQKFMVIK